MNGTMSIRLVLALFVCLIAWAPAFATAQDYPSSRVRVETVDGGVAIGELVESVPGQHITIVLATGEPRTFRFDEVVSVRDSRALLAPVAERALTPEEDYARRRDIVLKARPGLGPPLTLMATGPVLVVGGLVAEFNCGSDDFFEDYRCDRTGPIMLYTLGGVAAAVGTGLLVRNVVRRARMRGQLREIDEEFAHIRVDLSPTFAIGGHGANGVQLRLRF